MDNIGERLREERERLTFSQTALGAIGGVLKQAQLKYEKGERFPDAAYLNAIAKVGVDVLYIVTGTRSTTALTPDENELLERYRGAPIAVKAAAVAALIGGSAPQAAPRYTVDFGNAKIGQSAAGDIVNKARKK